MTLFQLLLLLAATLPPAILQVKNEAKNIEDLSPTKKSVQKEIVNKHNQLRQAVLPPGSDLLKMQWNKDVQVNAERWASQCTYKHSPKETRNIGMKCDENLFMANYPASWSSAIQEWYDESENVSLGEGPKVLDKQVEHYAQVGWKRPYQLGCGVTECPDQSLKYIFVCHYCFPGNYARRQYVSYTRGEPNDCEDGKCKNP